jgi:hypothetical protein
MRIFYTKRFSFAIINKSHPHDTNPLQKTQFFAARKACPDSCCSTDIVFGEWVQTISMEAIRAAADVSKPTLYTHYADKEALFADGCQATFNQLGIEQFGSLNQDYLPIQTQVELRIVLITFITLTIQQVLQSNYLALLRIVIGEMPHFPQLMEYFAKTYRPVD